jgi:molybdopterin-guanine dinucleotide biosynthesis protein A
VLCGGRSRRMGRDKALLPVDGEPMARRVAAALTAAGATEVIAVGGATAALADLGLTVVPDGPGLPVAVGEPGTEPAVGPRGRHQVGGRGPLVGIVTALGALGTDVILVVACDLVSPSTEAMAATVAALAAEPAADLAVPRQGEQHEWLHAAWRGTARPRLVEQLAAGERSVHGAVARAGLRMVAVDGLAARALVDADSPGDLPPQADRLEK